MTVAPNSGPFGSTLREEEKSGPSPGIDIMDEQG